MKQFLLTLILAAGFVGLYAQAPTGTEKAITDSICSCMSATDASKITTKAQATELINTCFTKQMSLLSKLADENHVDMTNVAAMRQLGVSVGKDLIAENCSVFIKLSLVLAGKEIDQAADMDEGISEGLFKRMDTRGFNYVVITGANGNEQSFIWLRQFNGSDKFMNGHAPATGTKLKISWKEIEVYIPDAKGYFKLKEITGVEWL